MAWPTLPPVPIGQGHLLLRQTRTGTSLLLVFTMSLSLHQVRLAHVWRKSPISSASHAECPTTRFTLRSPRSFAAIRLSWQRKKHCKPRPIKTGEILRSACAKTCRERVSGGPTVSTCLVLARPVARHHRASSSERRAGAHGRCGSGSLVNMFVNMVTAVAYNTQRIRILQRTTVHGESVDSEPTLSDPYLLRKCRLDNNLDGWTDARGVWTKVDHQARHRSCLRADRQWWTPLQQHLHPL